MTKHGKTTPVDYFQVYRKGEYPKPKKYFYTGRFASRRKAYSFAYNRWREGHEGLTIVHPGGKEEKITFSNSSMC